MKKIIDLQTKEEIVFNKSSLPIMVHGREHSGASLLSITIAVHLHMAGERLCIFTAYSMAREEFLKQVTNSENVFYLESDTDLNEAAKFQTIIVQSGNTDLFIKTITNTDIMQDRKIFVKNIETINTSILDLVKSYPFMVSGDLEINPLQQGFNNLVYKTKVFLSPMKGEHVPQLEKYQAFYKKDVEEQIIVLV